MYRFLTFIMVVPLFLSFYVDTSMELVDFSESLSLKANDYAGKMQDASHCATRGIPIEECSPGLLDVSFKNDVSEFKDINEKIINKTSEFSEISLD